MMRRIPYNTQDEWHAIRREHIGGSEVASLFNAFKLPDGQTVYRHLFQEAPEDGELLGSVSPYCSGVRLWHQKKGNIEAKPFDNPRTRAGRHFESGIASWTQELTKWDVRKVKDYLGHESIPGMGASLDYEILDHPSGHTAMDCKEVRWDKWKEQWLDAGDDPEPPLHIILQLHHQMACAQLPHGLAAVYVSGQDIEIVEIERNQNIITMCEEAVAAFWEAQKAGKEPDIAYDKMVAKDLYRTAGEDVQLDYSDNTEFQRLVETWDYAKSQARRWESAKEAAFHDIMADIKDASAVQLSDGRVLHAPTRKRKGYTKEVQPSQYRQLTIKGE